VIKMDGNTFSIHRCINTHMRTHAYIPEGFHGEE
jgi:hypothetical protein